MFFKKLKTTLVITGGSSGIGFKLVNFFLNKNFNVINIDKKKMNLKKKIINL